MAVWWVFEVVPIPVTAMLPLLRLPVVGVAPLKVVSANYGKPIIFLFLGGFMLALALERSDLHRRIALLIIRTIGSEPRRLLLGFMLASPWIRLFFALGAVGPKTDLMPRANRPEERALSKLQVDEDAVREGVAKAEIRSVVEHGRTAAKGHGAIPVGVEISAVAMPLDDRQIGELRQLIQHIRVI